MCVCVYVKEGTTRADYPGSFHRSLSHFNDNGRSVSISAVSLHCDPERR